MASIILSYSTFADYKQAQKVCTHLLKNRLIACANLFPIRSMYTWKGKSKKGREVGVIFKTRQAKWNLFVKELTRIHPYETPCILKFPVKTNLPFEQWVYEMTK